MSTTSYKLKIDGLRCIAIMMVLVEHFAYIIGGEITAGFYGVNLFFVISGFLITSILLKPSDQTFKRAYFTFLGRRFLRIFPIYYLTILFLYLINAKGINDDLIYLLTYTYNYKVGETANWDALYIPYWSLSVEEQFYLFFPILVLLMRKFSKSLLFVCVLIVILAELQMLFNLFFDGKYNYVGLFTNMAPLCLGAIGAILVQRNVKFDAFFKLKWVEFVVLAGLLLVLMSDSWKLRMVLIPLLNLYLVLKAGLFRFSFSAVESLLSNANVVFVGRISYGIYVYHLIVAFFFTKFLFDPVWTRIPFENFGILSKLEFHSWIIKFPVSVLLSILVAHLSFKYLEQPLLHLKDRYFRY
jgi:peptidoglycan/LPS O-acetylase OafA/YrhL